MHLFQPFVVDEACGILGNVQLPSLKLLAELPMCEEGLGLVQGRKRTRSWTQQVL